MKQRSVWTVLSAVHQYLADNPEISKKAIAVQLLATTPRIKVPEALKIATMAYSPDTNLMFEFLFEGIHNLDGPAPQIFFRYRIGSFSVKLCGGIDEKGCGYVAPSCEGDYQAAEAALEEYAGNLVPAS